MQCWLWLCMMIVSHALPDSGLSKQAESFDTSALVQSCVEFILMKLIRPADLKIHMFQQATDLWVPTIAKFLGNLYTWSYAHWWIYRVWAARYNTWLHIKLTPKGVVFFLSGSTGLLIS